MSEFGVSLSLIGLVPDIVGFWIIGRELLLHPDKRPYLGGGDTEFRIGKRGFCLVVIGFVGQFIGQLLSFLVDRVLESVREHRAGLHSFLSMRRIEGWAVEIAQQRNGIVLDKPA